VSHSTLLLRSVKQHGVPTRIDLIFKPVRHIILPTTLNGVDVREVDRSDLSAHVADAVGAHEPTDKVFALSGPTGGAWVVAGTMAWHEDAGEDSDPSHFSVPRLLWS